MQSVETKRSGELTLGVRLGKIPLKSVSEEVYTVV